MRFCQINLLPFVVAVFIRVIAFVVALVVALVVTLVIARFKSLKLAYKFNENFT